MEAPLLIVCKFCNSDEVQVISADPFGDEIIVYCTECEEIFEIYKDEIEENEYHED